MEEEEDAGCSGVGEDLRAGARAFATAFSCGTCGGFGGGGLRDAGLGFVAYTRDDCAEEEKDDEEPEEGLPGVEHVD